MDFDDALRLLCYRSDLSMVALATAAGLDGTRFRNWYHQRRRKDSGGFDTLNEHQLMRLARALGYEIMLRPTKQEAPDAGRAMGL